MVFIVIFVIVKVGFMSNLLFFSPYYEASQMIFKKIVLFFCWQKDMELRELREFNKNSIKQIGEVTHQNPDIAQAVHLYFSQVNLE